MPLMSHLPERESGDRDFERTKSSFINSVPHHGWWRGGVIFDRFVRITHAKIHYACQNTLKILIFERYDSARGKKIEKMQCNALRNL